MFWEFCESWPDAQGDSHLEFRITISSSYWFVHSHCENANIPHNQMPIKILTPINVNSRWNPHLLPTTIILDVFWLFSLVWSQWTQFGAFRWHQCRRIRWDSIGRGVICTNATAIVPWINAVAFPSRECPIPPLLSINWIFKTPWFIKSGRFFDNFLTKKSKLKNHATTGNCISQCSEQMFHMSKIEVHHQLSCRMRFLC